MKTKEISITIRVPIEIAATLKQQAVANHCSMSNIARDLIMSSLVIETSEHIFLSRATWGKAIVERDGYKCVQCDSVKDIEAHHIKPVYQGGQNILSNGETLCAKCHVGKHTTDKYLFDSENIHTSIPQCWVVYERGVKSARNGDASRFWHEQLACFMTKRKKATSCVVQKYVDTYLIDVPKDVIIRTLLTHCPTPRIIREFPSHKYIYKERFEPPFFITS